MNSDCIHKQPNAANCFVCGRDNPSGLHLKFYDNGGDTVKSVISLDDRFQGYPDIAHGGILASILDEVVGRVAMIEDHHRFMMTVILNVQYRHPVPINTELTAIGKAIRIGGRIGKAEGKIYLPDGLIACEATLTLADMPAEVATARRVGSLEWAVDPD